MKTKIILTALIFLGLLYRFYGLEENYSFWTDENHVAVFSRAILERGSPILKNGYNTGSYQWLMYWMSAVFMKIFGMSEFSARLPTVLFGGLSILSVYLLGSKLFGGKVALLSAFFMTFLNIEILFSRQLRPYQALQFFWILGVYFLTLFLKETRRLNCLIGVCLCGIVSSLFHYYGVTFFFNAIAIMLLFLIIKGRKDELSGIWLSRTKNIFFVALGSLSMVSLFLCLKYGLRFGSVGSFNYFYYYRVFLLHNYLPLVVFFFLGILFLFFERQYQKIILFLVFLGTQMIIISFLLGQPFTRYFYPVFPFLVILASYGILESGKWISDIGGLKTNTGREKQDIVSGRVSNIRNLISGFLVLLVVFFLWKSDKLSLLPQKIYSLNSDMQEIPEVDWKKIYSFLEIKLKENPDSVLVANWMDLPVWYLGEGKLDYLARTKEGFENDPFSGAEIINSKEKFINLIKKHQKGFLVMDSWDNKVPEGIREFSDKHLKKELEVDRLYQVQPRYWPVSVYSWGMN